MNKLFTFIMLWMMSCLPTLAQAPMDGGVWKDNTGKHINAHGGNIFNYKGIYYWYGESRSEDGKPYSSLGVSCFTSRISRVGRTMDWCSLYLMKQVATSRVVASSSVLRFSTTRRPGSS